MNTKFPEGFRKWHRFQNCGYDFRIKSKHDRDMSDIKESIIPPQIAFMKYSLIFIEIFYYQKCLNLLNMFLGHILATSTPNEI